VSEAVPLLSVCAFVAWAGRTLLSFTSAFLAFMLSHIAYPM
jgi:hypothetical protein